MGGLGLPCIRENLIPWLHARGTRNLTIVSNNADVDSFRVGMLLKVRQVKKKMIWTYVGENKEFEEQFLAGELAVDLVMQGTFSERIRAAGAGIGGFFAPTAYRTIAGEGKETRVIDGKPYVLERSALRRWRASWHMRPEGSTGRSWAWGRYRPSVRYSNA